MSDHPEPPQPQDSFDEHTSAVPDSNAATSLPSGTSPKPLPLPSSPASIPVPGTEPANAEAPGPNLRLLPPRRLPQTTKTDPLPPAPVTWTVAGLNVMVFLLMLGLAGPSVLDAPLIETLLKFGANHGPLTGNGQYWRLFTCMFVHIGALHIALNMWALLSFGPLVEKSFGKVRYTLMYLFAGLGASCVSVLWKPNLVSAGASGAIFGLFGGMLALTHVYRNEERKAEMKRRQKSILVLIVYNLAYGMIETNIDNGAHLGGLFFGFLTGLALAPSAVSIPPRLSGRSLGGGGAIALSIIGLACFIPMRVNSSPEVQFNTYVRKLQPLLKAQDAVIEGIKDAGKQATALTDAEYLTRVQGWRKTVEDSISEFRTIAPEGAELSALHQHMIDRAVSFAAALKELEQFATSHDRDALARYKSQMDSAGKALQDFVTARDAYFSKYGMHLVKKDKP